MKVKVVAIFEFDDYGEDLCEDCPFMMDAGNLDNSMCPYMPNVGTDEFEKWFGLNKRSKACKDSVKRLRK